MAEESCRKSRSTRRDTLERGGDPVDHQERRYKRQNQYQVYRKPLAVENRVRADKQDRREVGDHGGDDDRLPVTLAGEALLLQHRHDHAERGRREYEGHDPRVVYEALTPEDQARKD